MKILRIFAILAITVSGLLLHAQTSGEAKSLHMYISPHTSSVCAGRGELILDLVILNEGDSEAIVEPERFGGTLKVLRLSTLSEIDKKRARGVTGGTVIAAGKLRISKATGRVVLRPREAFSAELPISLADPFFKDSGIYNVIPTIGFGTFEKTSTSKEGILFQALDCD